ncbi:MAG: protein YgfX [Thiobacillus sp.]
MHEIEVKPSRRLGLLLAAMLALAWAALAASALPGSGALALGVAVLAAAVLAWRRAVPEGRLRLRSDGGIERAAADGSWEAVEVLGDSFVSPAMIVLRYRGADARRRTLTLLPDSADADALRRLRVSLRWARRTRSGTSSPDAG